MPKNKDLKRLVRARMNKTGESYTAARAHITGTANRLDTHQKSWPGLAGHSDATLHTRTGRTWVDWVHYLDDLGATEMTHAEIARHTGAVPGVSGWWAQTVAVGYERIRGLRDTNQLRDGEYQAGKSRTFPLPAATLYAAFTQSRRRSRWLPGVALTIRTAIENRSLRITWPDQTRVEVYFTPRGSKKTTVTITHRKLASRAAVTEAKASWTTRLSALATALDRR